MTPRKCNFCSQGSKIVELNNEFCVFSVHCYFFFFVSNKNLEKVKGSCGMFERKSVPVAVGSCSAATMLTHQVGTRWPNSFQIVAVRGCKRQISWIVLIKERFYSSCIGVWNQTVIEKLAFVKIKAEVVVHQSCQNYIYKSLFRRLQLSQSGILEHASYGTVSRSKNLFLAWVSFVCGKLQKRLNKTVRVNK